MPLLRAIIATAIFGLAVLGTPSAYASAATRIGVDGGRIVIEANDGVSLRGKDLVGTVLHMRTVRGNALDYRIDAVVTDPRFELELYRLRVRDNAAGRWRDYCAPDPDGRRLALPIPEVSSATAPGFRFTCMAGAEGKCVARGYLPWGKAANGEPLGPTFAACVRMLRADYCGDGTSFTRAGIRVGVSDRHGIRDDHTDMPFEAAWGPGGARCLTRTRLPDLMPLDEVLAACPALAARVREDCSPEATRSDPEVRLWNRSADRRVVAGRQGSGDRRHR